jgi:8-oxo-dGTP pyrophosphatase MutT (NUDIX family)
VGALPYRVGDDGQLEVLMITSRHSWIWVIPKGHLMAGLTWPEAAAQEALEEAGVAGDIRSEPIGEYRYRKSGGFGLGGRCVVTVYPLLVRRQADDWLERDQREQRWLCVADASRTAGHRSLARLIARFDAVERRG